MSDFRPVESHFHKPRGDPAHVKAIKITPRAKPLVKNYDALEYVAKHMFVGKAMPWPKAVSYVLSLSLSLSSPSRLSDSQSTRVESAKRKINPFSDPQGYHSWNLEPSPSVGETRTDRSEQTGQQAFLARVDKDCRYF